MGVETIVWWCFFLLSERVFAWSSLMEFEVPMLQVVPVYNNGSQPLNCTVVPAAKTLNWTTVSRISWVVNIDKGEEEALPSVRATLLDPAPPHEVTCRLVSYDRKHRRTFTLVSPSQTKTRTSKPGIGLPRATLEIVEGGSIIAEAKTVKASVGEVLRMRCQAINLPIVRTHVQIYMHLVQSSEDGIIETELNAVHPFGSRQELDTFVLLSEQDNHKRFYCQARWMEGNSSIHTRSVRSAPWRLTIEPGFCSVSSGLCVGLLAAGWAVAALVLVGAGVTVWCVWCRRRRSESRRSQITSTTSDLSRRPSAPVYEMPIIRNSKPDTVNVTPDPIKKTYTSKGQVNSVVKQGMPPHHAPSHRMPPHCVGPSQPEALSHRMPPYSARSSHEMPPHIAALHNATSHRNMDMVLSGNAAAMSRHRLPSESTVYENPDKVVYSNTLNLLFKMPERPRRY